METLDFHKVIQTRDALYNYLQSEMLLSEVERRAEHETGIVKSFVFEVDGDYRAPERGVTTKHLEALFGSVGQAKSGKKHVCSAVALRESGFFDVSYAEKGREPTGRLWLDTATDPRYWVAYSLSAVNGLDRWLPRVVKHNKDFDHVWLWPHFLEEVQRRGQPSGFGLTYDRHEVDKAVGAATAQLKMQVWGGSGTATVYDTLKEHLGAEVILSRIRMNERNGSADNFAVQALGYTGRFSVKGTDFTVHNGTLGYVRGRYREEIARLEACAIRWAETKSGHRSLAGSAIHIEPNNGEDLDTLTMFDQVFSGTLPFRLAAVPTRLSAKRIDAIVVDLHTAREFRLEMSPKRITLYLRSDTCGNTVARIYTNLQRYFGSRFDVHADNGEQFFGPGTR